LVTIVAVFLAYNANQGLPFVPTYELKAEIPGGENLVKGNEVRVGGFRVGIVSKIDPKVVTERGRSRAVALIELKLDKSVDPLARNLASPQTHLKDLFRELGNAAAQVAPVAEVQAQLFTNMADTFAAVSHNPAALQQTIAKSPPTLDTSISSLRVQRPFLA